MSELPDVSAVHRPALSTSAQYAMLILLSIAIVGLDQATKALAAQNLQDSPIELFNGALTLDYARNTGAAFSIFRSGDVALSLIAIVVCVGLVAYYQRIAKASPVARVAIGLILGGALGNLIDRIRLGYVVDFIDLHWWPVFNLADSAVVCGVVLLALGAWPMPSTDER